MFQAQFYPMELDCLGNVIIINNAADLMPGSEKDVTSLKDAFETVGFDVLLYNNCDTKVEHHNIVFSRALSHGDRSIFLYPFLWGH